MTATFNFEKLLVYQKSVQFSIKVFEITKTWPREHLFGLTDQLRRASLSIPSNIAEGYARSNKDFQHFLNIARGSCFECVPIITIACNLQLISMDDQIMLYNTIDEISRMTGGLKTSLKNKPQLSSLNSQL